MVRGAEENPGGSIKSPLGKEFAYKGQMSSLDNLYHKMVPTLDPATLAQLHAEPPPAESSNQIGREVAHELNNILTIIQGYADRILLKHGANAAWRPELQLISDNARRAVAVVKQATPRKAAMAKVLA